MSQVSRTTIDAIHLGTAILGWYCAICSPTPNAEHVERSLRLQLDACGLSEVTLPRDKEARRLLLDEVKMRLSRVGKADLASAVGLGWVMGLYDGATYLKDPETLNGVLELAAKVGIAEQSIRELIEERKSIDESNQAEILVRHIESWLRPEDMDAAIVKKGKEDSKKIGLEKWFEHVQLRPSLWGVG